MKFEILQVDCTCEIYTKIETLTVVFFLFVIYFSELDEIVQL